MAELSLTVEAPAGLSASGWSSAFEFRCGQTGWHRFTGIQRITGAQLPLTRYCIVGEAGYRYWEEGAELPIGTALSATGMPLVPDATDGKLVFPSNIEIIQYVEQDIYLRAGDVLYVGGTVSAAQIFYLGEQFTPGRTRYRFQNA